MSRKRKLDFTGVESYGKVSEGIHTAKIKEVEEKPSAAGDDMLVITFEVMKGDDKGSQARENFVLTDKALWKFKMLLSAIGMKADGKLVVDLDKLIGKVCDIEVFHKESNGNVYANISDYYKAGTKSGGSSTSDDEDEVDEEDEDEVEEEAPKKAKSKKAEKESKPAKKAKKPEPEEEEEDEDLDDEEEEEEEAPKKSKKDKAKKDKKAEKPAKKSKKKPEPEEDDEDEDEDDWEED